MKIKMYKKKYTLVDVDIPDWKVWVLKKIFGSDQNKEEYGLMMQQIKKRAYSDAFDAAIEHVTNSYRYAKEEAMGKKLLELGYEIQCNRPMADNFNFNDLQSQTIDPNDAWIINPKK